MTKLVNPVPLFLDGRGALLDAGSIYIGTANTDPEIVGNRLPLFWDVGLTLPALQPLRTLGGMVMNGALPSFVYFAAADFSITIRDADSNLVAYIPTAFNLGSSSYQPLDSDLTTIAAAANAAFGLALLTLANQAALQGAVGVGSAGLLAKATAAQFRSNVADKVLTADNVWGAATYVALAPGASVALDLNTGINFTLAMGGNYTLANPTNAKEGQSGNILITQDGTGTRTLAYGTSYKPIGGSAPTLSTAANARDLLFYEVIPGPVLAVSLAKNIPA